MRPRTPPTTPAMIVFRYDTSSMYMAGWATGGGGRGVGDGGGGLGGGDRGGGLGGGAIATPRRLTASANRKNRRGERYMGETVVQLSSDRRVERPMSAISPRVHLLMHRIYKSALSQMKKRICMASAF